MSSEVYLARFKEQPTSQSISEEALKAYQASGMDELVQQGEMIALKTHFG